MSFYVIQCSLFDLKDVAISAPFGAGSGKVYIYYGSVADTISQTVQQVKPEQYKIITKQG